MKLLIFFLLLPLELFAHFEATAVVQVHPSMIAIQPLGQPEDLMTKGYMEHEFEKVVAPETLRTALRLLQPKQAKDQAISDEAIAELRKKISTKPRRGTDFILITAQGETEKEALLVANTVAEAYIDQRKLEEVARAKRALTVLDDELLAQSKQVQESRKELATLIEKFGIAHVEAGPRGELTEEDMLQKARQKLEEFEIASAQIETQIKKLEALDGDELVLYAATLHLPGATKPRKFTSKTAPCSVK